MGRRRSKPLRGNALEKEFFELVQRHGKEVSDAYNAALDLADKYGIPVGKYVPQDFIERFGNDYDDEKDEEIIGVSIDLVLGICDVDDEYWQSSTFHCEIYYGG